MSPSFLNFTRIKKTPKPPKQKHIKTNGEAIIIPAQWGSKKIKLEMENRELFEHSYKSSSKKKKKKKQRQKAKMDLFH